MSNFVHVYIDDEQVIQEIELSDANTFDQYHHIAITNDESDEVLDLYQRREQHASIKLNKFKLVEIDGKYRVKKAVYIYYHFKDKSIRSITPRKQEVLDNDGDLRSGLVVVDELLEACINGTKSMINCRANTDGDMLVFEEIKVVKIKFNIANTITLIMDYEVKETNEEAVINIVYDENTLNIKRTDDGIIDKKIELFFMNRFDKTLFYGSVDFMFTKDQEEIEIPLTLDNNYMVISSDKMIMTFNEV